MIAAAVLWRRLNAPGHDACELLREPDGWTLRGSAVFMEGEEIAELRYEVKCDAAWRSRSGEVDGWLGRRKLNLRIGVDDQQRWQINGRHIADVDGCIDLDLNFTPATNLIQFRRLTLATGVRVEAPAAWLEVPSFELRRLSQLMQRDADGNYDYAAPSVGYAGLLRVHPSGIVLEYPALWHAEKVHVFDL